MDEDDDDIYELEFDDPAGDPDFPGKSRPGMPPPSFRERLGTLKPSRSLIPSRRTARLLVIGLLAAALGAGTAATATAWYDTAVRHDREADVVKLVMTALTDGDPALSKLDQATGIATEQYVLEFANNGPVAVTVTEAALVPQETSATEPYSTAWGPLGSASVAPGKTGRVALTMRLPCREIDYTSSDPGELNPRFVQVPTGAGSNSTTISIAGQTADPAPALTVATPNGHQHSVQLHSPTDIPRSTSAISDFSRAIAPQTVRLQNSACVGLVTGSSGEVVTLPGELPPRPATPAHDQYPLSLRYNGLTTPATVAKPDITMKFTVTNITTGVVDAMIPDDANGPNGAHAVRFDPANFTLAPGAAKQVLVTYSGICTQTFDFQPFLDATITVAAAHDVTEKPLTEYLAGPSLQFTIDVTTQEKAAC